MQENIVMANLIDYGMKLESHIVYIPHDVKFVIALYPDNVEVSVIITPESLSIIPRPHAILVDRWDLKLTEVTVQRTS